MLRSTLSIVLVSVAGLACLAEPAAAAQDPKAVEHAATLRKNGVRVDEIVAQLAATFRLDAAGAAQVLGRLDVAAAEVLPALEAAFRIDAMAAVSALAQAGFSAENTATAAAVRRLPHAEAATALRAANYKGEEAIPALLVAYRLEPAAAGVPLREAGYTIDDIARGLRSAPWTQTSDIVASLRLADFDPKELRRVAIHVLTISPGAYAAMMKEAGASVLEVAQALKDDYGLAPTPAGDTLIFSADFYGSDVAAAFRLVWQLDVLEAFQALEDMSIDFGSIWNVLEIAGYEVGRPRIHRYRIADYRPGHSDEWIENVGVVDPDRVTPIAPDPWNGEVEILLGHRNLDEMSATLGGRDGEILGREPFAFQADGTAYDGEWLRVRFRDFTSGYLALHRRGMSYSVPAAALAYHILDAELIAGPLGGLDVTLGDPVGSGTVTLAASTAAGIPVTARTIELEIPTHRDAGIEADVVDLASNTVSVTTQAAGQGVVQMRVEIGFEEGGAEVDGTFLEYIPCWKCSTFEVPLDQCPGVNIPCLVAAIGTAIGTIGTCTNPDNWEEVEVASGPALPFQADLTSPALTIDITIGPQGPSGAFAAYQVLPQFTAGVTLRTNHGDLSVGPIENGILAQVNAGLMQSIQELALGDAVVQALEGARSLLGWGNVQGVYVLDDGRLFIDAKH